MAKEEEKPDVERKLFEVRRTTMVEKIESHKFVFEKHGDDWHAHFAAGSDYSLEQMKEIVAAMETLPSDGVEIKINEKKDGKA